MSSSDKELQIESLALWKVKLQLASQGSYQAIQQLKQHVLDSTDQQHPIFKQSFYEILQQGYQLHQVQKDKTIAGGYETYKDFPLFFLLVGAVEVRCINLEGDNEVVLRVKGKGLIVLQQEELTKKYGLNNINLLTKFQIFALEQSIVLEIEGSNRMNQILQRKKISQKEMTVMRRFMLFPSKQVVRVTVNSTNQGHIKDRVYLLAGKACYYLDDQKQFGRRLILCCFEEGYLNPKQFEDIGNDSTIGIPSSFNIIDKKQQETDKLPAVKLHIFQQSELLYLEQNFLKDDLIKAYEMKRQEHITQIIQGYRSMRGNKESIEAAQNHLMMRFKLSKKQVNTQVYKIPEVAKKQKMSLTAKESLIDRKTKSKNDLISTSSSIKCAIRIRKSKKVS